jgi:hypothetical protein
MSLSQKAFQRIDDKPVTQSIIFALLGRLLLLQRPSPNTRQKAILSCTYRAHDDRQLIEYIDKPFQSITGRAQKRRLFELGASVKISAFVSLGSKPTCGGAEYPLDLE